MTADYTETYEYFASIIATIPFGIIAINVEGHINLCNISALQHLNIAFKTKEVIDKDIYEFVKHIPKIHKALLRCREKGSKAFNFNEVKVANKLISIKARIIKNGMIITTTDITKIKMTERKILADILEGQENVRKRLAEEIHDSIGPIVSTMKLNMESIRKDIQNPPEKTILKMNSMDELLSSASKDIRNISHALIPSAIMDFGLIAAIENLCMKINTAEDLVVNFNHTNMKDRIEPTKELGLFRITQELVNNILKHANAVTINIQIDKHPNDMTLIVEDDGVGFDQEKLPILFKSGIGLSNIKARSEALAGTFILDAAVGRGVIATIELPI